MEENKQYTLKQIRVCFDENITQESFAEKVGIPYRRYQDLETGRTELSAREMMMISEVTNTKPSAFKFD